jgi:hypothetical protein
MIFFMIDNHLIAMRKSLSYTHPLPILNVFIYRLFVKNRKISDTYICYLSLKEYRQKHVCDIIIHNLSQRRLLRYSVPW